MFFRKICCDFTQNNVIKTRNIRFYRNLASNLKDNVNRDVILQAFESVQINSVKDWTNVRKAILEHELNRGQYSNNTIDAMILGHCVKTRQFDLGASYITFLNQEKIKPNLATVGKYLRLIYLKNQDSCLESGKPCKVSEEKLIFKHYEDLRKDYPVLDSISLENITCALSLTTRWRQCLDLLKEIKVSVVPSSTAYSTVIASCFSRNEESLGWELLREMLEYERVPQSVAYLAYIKSVAKIRKKTEALEKLEQLFLFLQENNLKCDEDVGAYICQTARKLGYRSDFTIVTHRGLCRSCSRTLNNFDLTDEDFNELRTKVFEKVIVGRDVFVKTSPEELERFKNFAASMGQFDVVLDGLNIAYSAGTKQQPFVYSSLVALVVSHFVQKRKKVLVLGRAHMNRWPKKNWGYVTQNASVFLAQDISQDDPYLLYCALNSGKDTVIVTRDLMRSHKFLLRDPRLKMLFDRWLSQRQWHLLRVDERKGPIFRIPPPFSIVAQCNDGTWHIPYETDAPKDKNEFHSTWLCLKK
ncbi:mitochondrial ribonuclease P catalytic subunit [Anoplophora glabripennis]|uniref:mitochondrial ribonuclease P catalytic subunit n=1 Tax=Anoplophora glabripennis TaxID=217634 RepID=UPI0008749AEC|nr:mitochondrial ribonuclease P catalytic subunit [Anoplophora glabripennis]